MTTIKEVSIPETQLKLRWREPYVTDGINKALSVLDPGAYRGGYVEQTDPVGTSFRITARGEQDSHFLWVDKSTGTALSVRYGADVLVDMSDRFTGPGGTLPSAQAWYVWIDCVYTVGGATSGKIYVGDALPGSANAVLLARIDMPFGATAILDSYINFSTTYRTVAHVNRPVLLARTDLEAVSTNKFQIAGKVYCPGGSLSFDRKDLYINLLSQTGFGKAAYTGDDGAAIWVKKVWADSGLSANISSDSEGFVLDPWVELDVSETTDTTPPTCNVRYWTRGTLRDLVLSDQIREDWLPHEHATFVAAREKAGYPTSLVKGTVQEHIEELLEAVNARISAQAPESAPASPVLLWRSHNIASDVLVTGTTISIYWGSNLGFAVIVGGYISGANAVRATVDPGEQMVLLRLHGNLAAGPELLSSPSTSAPTRPWNDPTLWAAGLYTMDFFGAPVFTMPMLIANLLSVLSGMTLDSATMLLSSHESFVVGLQPGSGGLHAFCRLFESGGAAAKVRLYYGDGSFWLTYNAEWVGAGKWVEDTDTQNAIAAGIGLVGYDSSFLIYKKQNHNMDGSGWVPAAWDSVISYGSAMGVQFGMFENAATLAMPIVLGKYMDVCKWCLHRLPDAGTPDSRMVYTSVTYHAVLVPNYIDVVEQGSVGTPGIYDIGVVTTPSTTVDEYGFVIEGRALWELGTCYAWGLAYIWDY